MANIFKRIIEWFKPKKNKNISNSPVNEPENKGADNTSQINMEYLIDEIDRQFRAEMDKLTVNRFNNVLIKYPMSFNIMLNKDDYKLIGEAIRFSLSMAVLGFYVAIKEKVDNAVKNGEKYTYMNPANTWFFQWAESVCKEGDDGHAQTLEHGKIVIISHIEKVEVTNANIETLQNTGCTSRVINSNTKQTNTNPNALAGTSIGASNTSEWTFDPELPTDINLIYGTIRDKQNAYAILSYEVGKETKRYAMLDTMITISGSKDQRRNFSNIFVIESDKVKTDILRIRYLKKENIFQISAYGDVRVNESLLPVSESNTYNWQDLSCISKILLPDAEIQIFFKASDDIITRAK